jgi:arylesterase / paraoxonase
MKIFLKIFIGIIAILLIFVGRMLYNSGFFTKIAPHFEGTITEVNGFEGAEDIAIDTEKGFAFISSNDFSSNQNNGAIYLLNLNEANPKPINLTSKLPFESFHPHGISFYKATNGQKQLFVVNHRNTGNYIEIFKFTNSTLVYQVSISDPLFVSPNDVLAIGERAFYLTNDHNEKLSDWRSKKDFLQIPMGNVCYYDGKNAKIVADGFNYANGINKSIDGKKIFVAATSGQKIRVFDREVNTGILTESDEIKINGADNIDVDQNGNLWVGCHPKLLAFLAHSKDHSAPSPSEIIKIEYKNKGDYNLKSIYLNDGKPVSGSSVGAVYGNQLLIGTVFEDKILIAKMN